MGPEAGRSFSCPVLDEFDIDGSGAVALPKEILDSLDALVTDWYLSATVVLKTRCNGAAALHEIVNKRN